MPESTRPIGQPKSSPAASIKSDSNFRDSLTELESITKALESDDIGLDEAISHFERGSELAAGLQEQLRAAQTKIEKIKLRFETSEEPSTTV